MPNNVFSITISATDKATATIRKINDSMSKITRPFEEVGKSFKSLGREIGIDKIGKNLSKMGSHARDAAGEIGRIVGPLAGITGIATVAGIVRLADGWATLGRSITYSSQNIGIGTTKLQEFQGAARMAGLSGDAMTQSLLGLGNTMESALAGRNQQALMLFNRLTGGVKGKLGGPMHITAQYDALAKAIYRLKTPQQQWLAASQFGLTELLPLIRKYRGNMKAARADAEKQGFVMTPEQIKSANDYANALSKLSLQGTVLKNTIGNALIPALMPLIDELAQWINKNRDLIATDVGDWMRDFATWVKSIDWKELGSEARAFIDDVNGIVKAMGGWKVVAGVLGGILVIKTIAPVVSLVANMGKLLPLLVTATTGVEGLGAAFGSLGVAIAATAGAWAGTEIWKHMLEGTKAGDKIGEIITSTLADLGDKNAQKALEEMKANSGAVAGLTAPVSIRTHDVSRKSKYFHPERTDYFKQRQAEAMKYFMSQGWSRAQAAGIVGNLAQESSLEPSAINPHGGARGIGQWMGARAALFQKIEGVPLSGASYQKQLDFVNWELRHSEARAGNMLARATTPASAALVFGIMDERFGNDGSLGKRIGFANSAFDATGVYSAGGVKGGSSKVHVEVTVKGLPPGTTAKVDTTGATTATARVAHTTVGSME